MSTAQRRGLQGTDPVPAGTTIRFGCGVAVGVTGVAVAASTGAGGGAGAGVPAGAGLGNVKLPACGSGPVI